MRIYLIKVSFLLVSKASIFKGVLWLKFMTSNNLGILLAGGEGSRVRHLLEEDEPVKPMIKVGERRLFEHNLDLLRSANLLTAALTFPSEKYVSLDKMLNEREVRVLKQKASHLNLPSVLELPVILLAQYHFSSDSSYLKGFDSITTVPCDIVFENLDFNEVVRFHDGRGERNYQVTIILGENSNNTRKSLFRLDGNRVTGYKKYNGVEEKGYVALSDPGVYFFSHDILNRPFSAALNMNDIRVNAFITQAKWKDYGNPENLMKLRR